MPKRIARVGGGKVYKTPTEQGEKQLTQPRVHSDPELSVFHNRQVRHEDRMRIKDERRQAAYARTARMATVTDAIAKCATMSERAVGRPLWQPERHEDIVSAAEIEKKGLNWRIRQAHIVDKSLDIDEDGTVSSMDIKVARAVSSYAGQTKLNSVEKARGRHMMARTLWEERRARQPLGARGFTTARVEEGIRDLTSFPPEAFAEELARNRYAAGSEALTASQRVAICLNSPFMASTAFPQERSPRQKATSGVHSRSELVAARLKMNQTAASRLLALDKAKKLADRTYKPTTQREEAQNQSREPDNSMREATTSLGHVERLSRVISAPLLF